MSCSLGRRGRVVRVVMYRRRQSACFRRVRTTDWGLAAARGLAGSQLPNLKKSDTQSAALRKAIRHAIERCRERYDLSLNAGDYQRLVSQIKEKKARYITTGKILWRSLWEVDRRGKKIMAVYDEYPGIIVTFIPPAGEGVYH